MSITTGLYALTSIQKGIAQELPVINKGLQVPLWTFTNYWFMWVPQKLNLHVKEALTRKTCNSVDKTQDSINKTTTQTTKKKLITNPHSRFLKSRSTLLIYI